MTSPYRVGRNRPPLHSRFKKGRSGNPGGRPKGLRNLASVLSEVLGANTRATINGEEREMTCLEAVTRQLAEKALAGDTRALAQLFAEIHRNEATLVRETAADVLAPADEEVLKTLYARLTRDALAQRKSRKGR